MDSKLKIPPEIIDGLDTPEEYHFSNPGPTDPPKRNSGSMNAGISVSKISRHFGCRNSPCRRRSAARFTPSLAAMTARSH